MNMLNSLKYYCPLRSLYMTNLIVIVIIFFLSFSSVFAETDISEPLEIWSNDNDDKIEEAVTKDKETEEEAIQSLISQSDIAYSAYDTIGIYDQTNNGFNPTIWENSNFVDVKYLIDQLSNHYQYNNISNFLDKTLLTISTPPNTNDILSQSFLDLKMNYYVQSQNDNIVQRILDQINQDDWSDYDLINYINYHLVLSNYKKVCVKKYLNQFKEKKTKLIYQTFCKAMSNNLPATDLLLSLLQEQGNADKELIYILNAYINGQEIDLKKIKLIDPLKLNLIDNKNIDFSDLISIESNIGVKKYYALSDLSSTEKKINITEELVRKNILKPEVLLVNYKAYLNDKNIFSSIDYKSAKNDLEKRVFLFSQIRNSSDQKDLAKLATNFMDEIRSGNMLYASNNLIYDKIKVIQPKKEYSKQAFDICILLIMNNNNDRCREWGQLIKFNKDLILEYSLIEYYLLLNTDQPALNFNEELLNNIILSDQISELNKNIIVKYFQIKTNNKYANYWKSKSKLNKVSTIVPNIRLIEYLKNASNDNIGEAALLILILNDDKKFSELDDFSIFAILEALNKIDPKTMKKLIFEISLKNIVL